MLVDPLYSDRRLLYRNVESIVIGGARASFDYRYSGWCDGFVW